MHKLCTSREKLNKEKSNSHFDKAAWTYHN